MPKSPVVGFAGVYNADTGIAGEAKYVFAKLTGRASCALCDITHGTSVRAKSAWRRCTAGSAIPIETFHRNDQPGDIAEITAGRLPCVVARHADGALRIAVSAAELLGCDHDVSALEELLDRYRSSPEPG